MQSFLSLLGQQGQSFSGAAAAGAAGTEQIGRWHRVHVVAMGHHWCKALGWSSPQRQAQHQGLLELI